jgi:hypothetical protein
MQITAGRLQKNNQIDKHNIKVNQKISITLSNMPAQYSIAMP